MANIINGTDTGSGGLITTGDSSDELQLQTAETTAVTIDSSQNVGVGTTTPVSELNVNGVIVVDDGARSNPTGGASVVIDYQTTADLQGRIRSRDWDGAAWKNLTFEANNILFSGGGSERARITSDGYLRMASGSGGIQFGGDTAAANALDDYEEGTWTPTLATGTVSNSSGKYRKIGSVVTVWAVLDGFSDRASANVVTVNNLPFTATADSGTASGGALGRYISTLTTLVPYVFSNQTSHSFYNVSSGVYTQLQHSQLNNAASTLYYFATYTTG